MKLKPSTSTYLEWLKLTSKALGVNHTNHKPNKRLLELARMKDTKQK